MNVKVALKFRGREMAHTEIGFEVVNKFIAEIAPFGHPDFTPKLVGRAINLMITPLPRAKRAKNPRVEEGGDDEHGGQAAAKPKPPGQPPGEHPQPVKIQKPGTTPAPVDEFNNNPFTGLEVK